MPPRLASTDVGVLATMVLAALPVLLISFAAWLRRSHPCRCPSGVGRGGGLQAQLKLLAWITLCCCSSHVGREIASVDQEQQQEQL
jgi:hypothetical protein